MSGAESDLPPRYARTARSPRLGGPKGRTQQMSGLESIAGGRRPRIAFQTAKASCVFKENRASCSGSIPAAHLK